MRAITKTVLAGGVAVIALAGCGGSSGGKTAVKTAADSTTGTGSDRSTIVVAGHGKVEGTPDTATVTLGVSTQDASAQTALNKNNQEEQSLIDTLKSKGVVEKDIQTMNLSVQPNFDNKSHITGYSVDNTVTVKLHDIKNAGSVIDAAAAAAGNDVRMEGVALSIDNTSSLVAKARADAVKDAIAQGHQLADAAGVPLGAIHTIDDTGTNTPAPIYYNGASAKVALSDSPALTPVQAGSQELSVDVNVVFDLG